MRILTCTTSGGNGKRIRTSSAMVCPGFNPRVLPSHFSLSVSLLFRHVADLDPVPALQSDFRAACSLANGVVRYRSSRPSSHLAQPGIDVVTSGMSAAMSLRGFVPDPPWKRGSIRAVPTHAGGPRLRDPLK
jgi:hypothetical protein